MLIDPELLRGHLRAAARFVLVKVKGEGDAVLRQEPRRSLGAHLITVCVYCRAPVAS